MGIRFLTLFIEKHYRYKKIKLQGHLVIDGLSLAFTIRDTKEMDWIHGGQYWELRNELFKFFNALSRSNIKPIVVMDGVTCYKEEAFKRRQRTTSAIYKTLLDEETRNEPECIIAPAMFHAAFRNILHELQILLYVVDSEGDWDTVAIANYYGCPILSNDSDYYMYNVEGGYIPLHRLHWEDAKEPVTAELYTLNDFLVTFGFIYNPIQPCHQLFHIDSHAQMYLFIPAVLGNDYITSIKTKFPELRADIVLTLMRRDGLDLYRGNKFTQILEMVQYFCMFSSADELFNHLLTLDNGRELVRILNENYQKAKSIYIVEELFSVEKLFSGIGLKTVNGIDFPKWIVHEYRQGHFASSILELLICGKYGIQTLTDNPFRESGQSSSEGIRQSIYSILSPYIGKDELIEVVQCKGTLQEQVVPIQQGVLHLPTIDKVHELSQLNRLYALCTVMECDPVMLEGFFDDKWKLPLLATCYWVRHTCPELHLIHSLVLCFIICSHANKDPLVLIPPEFEEERDEEWLDVLHSFSMWQCVYCDAMKLNCVLNRPVSFISPAVLFDGRLSMFFATFKNDLIEEINKQLQGEFINLFRKVLDAVMSHKPKGKKRKRRKKKDKSIL